MDGSKVVNSGTRARTGAPHGADGPPARPSDRESRWENDQTTSTQGLVLGRLVAPEGSRAPPSRPEGAAPVASVGLPAAAARTRRLARRAPEPGAQRFSLGAGHELPSAHETSSPWRAGRGQARGRAGAGGPAGPDSDALARSAWRRCCCRPGLTRGLGLGPGDVGSHRRALSSWRFQGSAELLRIRPGCRESPALRCTPPRSHRRPRRWT